MLLQLLSANGLVGADDGLDIVLVDDGKGGISTFNGLLDIGHEIDHRYDTGGFGLIVVLELKSILPVLLN